MKTPLMLLAIAFITFMTFLVLMPFADAQTLDWGQQIQQATQAKLVAQAACGLNGCPIDPNVAFGSELIRQQDIAQQQEYNANLAIEIARIQQQQNINLQVQPAPVVGSYSIQGTGMPMPGYVPPSSYINGVQGRR